MTCLDCYHCKQKEGIVKCVKGHWFGQAYDGEITFTSEFITNAPKQKKVKLVRFFNDCKDFVEA